MDNSNLVPMHFIFQFWDSQFSENVRGHAVGDPEISEETGGNCSYLLTGSEISHGLVFMADNTENYHRSSNKRLFNNLKNILYNFNGI